MVIAQCYGKGQGNYMQAVCDKGCNSRFEVSFKVDTVKEGIEKIYFACPECSHEYIAFYSNAAIKKLQEEQRKLLRKTDPGQVSHLRLKKIMLEVEQNKRLIKSESDRLRRVVE